jgi:hypothetical protein
LAEKTGWTADEIKAWFDGTFPFDTERARHLAQSLELDVPLFVGKAFEVSLRSTAGGRS